MLPLSQKQGWLKKKLLSINPQKLFSDIYLKQIQFTSKQTNGKKYKNWIIAFSRDIDSDIDNKLKMYLKVKHNNKKQY